MFRLNSVQQQRLADGIKTALSIPFIGDIDGFTWQSIFAYTKNLPLQASQTSVRTKRLFNLVDPTTRTGWSAKVLGLLLFPGVEFELAIQRADIFGRAEELGFSRLSAGSPASLLGSALLKHWGNETIFAAMGAQGVSDPRICALLKSKDRTSFAYFEARMEIPATDEIKWSWTDRSRTGLQGVRKSDQFLKYRWYPNQKHFFERFTLPQDAELITVPREPLPLPDLVQLLNARQSAAQSKN